MDHEKKYKEALEKARKLCAYPTTKPFISDLQDLFPELRESEDEIGRRWLYENATAIFETGAYREDEESDIKMALEWLEKQGKQLQGKSALEAAKEEKVDNQNCVNPVNNVEPKFREGEWITIKE